MAQFHLQGKVSADDHTVYVKMLAERRLAHSLGSTTVLTQPWVTWVSIVLSLGLIGFRGLEHAQTSQHFGQLYLHSSDWILGGLAVLVLLNVVRRPGRQRGSLAASAARDASIEGVTIGPAAFEADDTGLTVRHDHRRTRYDWRAFERVTDREGRLLLELSALSGVIVPANAFADDDARDTFCDAVQSQIDLAADAHPA